MAFKSKTTWVLFIAPPGGGKGTQLTRVYERLTAAGKIVLRVGSGAIFSSPPAEIDPDAMALVKQNMKEGILVPDPTTLSIVGIAMQAMLAKSKSPDFVILDGVVRNEHQLAALIFLICTLGFDKFITIELDTDEKTLLHRLSTRLTCSTCREPFSMADHQEGGNCPACGATGSLKAREDDKLKKSVRERLDIYARDTFPVLKAIRTWRSTLNIEHRVHVETVTGGLSVEAVTSRIMAHLIDPA